MATQTTEKVDTRWNLDTRPGGDATKAALSLARIWRGYILCVYLDNDKKSNDVWTNIYDPYKPDKWFGAHRLASPGKDSPTVLSTMPPAVGYLQLQVVVLTSSSRGQLVANVISYPADADAPDEYKAIAASRQVATEVADLDASARPAMVNLNNTLVCAYRTNGGGISTLTGSLEGSGNLAWRPSRGTGVGEVIDGPSLTVFGGKLWCAYTHAGGQVMVMSSADGVSWTAPHATPGTSACGPALSADPRGTQLELMYAESDGWELHTLSSGDGVNWGTPAKCAGLTKDAPALVASSAGLLLACYRGSNSDDVYCVTTKAGTWPLT